MQRRSSCTARSLALAAALFVASVGGASAQTADPDPAASAGEQVLRPGDAIRVTIWRERDLSGDFLVDADGFVVLPMLGPLQVHSESPASLKANLVTAYQEYLRNPSIEVHILRRINILGAVRNPGLYPVDETMTLTDAVALAGGAMPHGNPDKMDLLRNGETVTTRLSQRTQIRELPIRSGDQLFVPERHWVSRNANVVAAAISASVSLAIALFIRR